MPHRADSSSPAPGSAGRRPRNARGEGDKLREEIIEAVIRLIADERRMRPMPLSLREVAREAGITAPAIYLHFADKEELTRAAFSRLFARLVEVMDQADEEAAARPPAGRLAAVAHAYCRFAEEHPASFRVMFAAPVADGTAQVAERWRTAVARLAETGMRLTQAPETAAMSVWSSVHGRLLLDRSASGLWQLGDVHAFVDDLARSLTTID
ncbi:TetR/AcrR family transcriptional regulator [Nonomuraea insulae]|uniref:TetR/AcrR family transcriptional regulator n=1 Tax=Nonomuraea insulae TaxID=1616787 RepID=A0ABW1D8A2_9ACTN